MIEKLNADIRNLDSEIICCLNSAIIIKNIGCSKSPDGYIKMVESIFATHREFSKFSTIAELYLTTDIVEVLEKIKKQFSEVVIDLYMHFRSIDEDFYESRFNKLKEDYESFQKYIQVFFDISRNALNENAKEQAY